VDEIATNKNVAPGWGATMADDKTERGDVICFHSTTEHLPCQPSQLFDPDLSLQIDHAVARADELHTACLDAWQLCQHAAGEALRLAGLRDRCLAEVIRLESLMPEGEDKR